MLCPHGRPIQECEKCFGQAKAITEALRAGDTEELERLGEEVKRDHERTD